MCITKLVFYRVFYPAFDEMYFEMYLYLVYSSLHQGLQANTSPAVTVLLSSACVCCVRCAFPAV